MKAIGNFLLGIALLGVGVVIFLSNVQVYGFGFYSFGRISTGPILLILLAVLFLSYFLTGRKICLWLCLLTILGLIVAMVLGTSFHIKTMSALDLGLILGMTVAGLGLFLRGLLGLKK